MFLALTNLSGSTTSVKRAVCLYKSIFQDFMLMNVHFERKDVRFKQSPAIKSFFSPSLDWLLKTV